MDWMLRSWAVSTHPQTCGMNDGMMDEHDLSLGIHPKRLGSALQGGDGTRLV